jgi:Protein of unknown function (DUF3185)
MNSQRTIGIVLLAAGLVLFIVGMNASDSLADRWSNFFTGHFTDATVWYLVGGIASAAMGFILMSGRKFL